MNMGPVKLSQNSNTRMRLISFEHIRNRYYFVSVIFTRHGEVSTQAVAVSHWPNRRTLLASCILHFNCIILKGTSTPVFVAVIKLAALLRWWASRVDPLTSSALQSLEALQPNPPFG